MYRVTRLNPVSWAKAYTLASLVIMTVIGLLFFIPIVFISVVAAASSNDGRWPILAGIPVMIVLGLIGLALLAVFVFIIALVQGAAFSWALGRVGGLEVDLALGPGYRVATTAEEPPAAPAEPALTAETVPMTEEAVEADAATLPKTSEASPASELPAPSEPPPPDLPDVTEDLPPGGA